MGVVQLIGDQRSPCGQVTQQQQVFGDHGREAHPLTITVIVGMLW